MTEDMSRHVEKQPNGITPLSVLYQEIPRQSPFWRPIRVGGNGNGCKIRNKWIWMRLESMVYDSYLEWDYGTLSLWMILLVTK